MLPYSNTGRPTLALTTQSPRTHAAVSFRGRRLASLVSLAALICACSSRAGGPGEDTNTAPAASGAAKVSTTRSKIELAFDRVVYRHGSELQLTLDFAQLVPADETLQVAVAAPDSADAEIVTLTRAADGVYTSQALPLVATASDAGDGQLSVAAGEMLHALYVVDRADPALAAVDSDVITDFALTAGSYGVEVRVDPAAALTPDELSVPEGSKPIGTLIERGGLPAQLATHELILYPRDEHELERFLARTGGTVTAEQSVDSSSQGDDSMRAVLVALQPPPVGAEQLAPLRHLFGADNDLLASTPDVLNLLALALEARADGFVVSANPRLQALGAPAITPGEDLSDTMRMVPANPATAACVPGSASAECVLNVPALWAFTALWEGDERNVRAAVLDTGFVPNADFRQPSGPLHECDMSIDIPLPFWFGRGGFPCGTGRAQGATGVAGDWHGTGVVTTLGGSANNGWGAAGVGGFSVEPMLYKNNVLSFAFELGAGIRQAVSDGASLVNISAGYPCAGLAHFGPIEYCTPEGRIGVCGVVTAGLAGAAAETCAKFGWIPFVGAGICTTAIGGATVAAATCVASIGYGDLRDPMASAVREATSRGVPVVAAAGNALRYDQLPPVIRDLLDLSDWRVERWGLIPASLPDVIAVGAVDGRRTLLDGSLNTAFLDNQHFYGDKVAVWAPTGSRYYAPVDPNDPLSMLVPQALDGTSGATPFVSGVIASMMAVNPDLDPRAAERSAEETRQIVPKIRELLTSTAFTNATLKRFGYTDQPDERRLLVNPLAAVTAAVTLRYPILPEYDESVNFSELLTPNDSPARPIPLPLDTPQKGTVLTMPVGLGVTPATPDEDWYAFTMPGDAGTMQAAEILLSYPYAGGSLDLTGGDVALSYVGVDDAGRATRRYRALAAAGSDVRFRVIAGLGGSDNTYRVQAGGAEAILPSVDIRAPSAAAPVCAGELVTLSADVSFPGFASASAAAASALEWYDGGALIGTGNGIQRSFTEGEHTLTARAYGSAEASDSITLLAERCPGEPPRVSITAPARDLILPQATGYDGNYYVDVMVSAIATDSEDGTLSGAAIVWKTDRGDLQPLTIGTGTSRTLRLYADSCSLEHVIRVEATDSDGNVATDTVSVYATILC
jgi:hypothetical protein